MNAPDVPSLRLEVRFRADQGCLFPCFSSTVGVHVLSDLEQLLQEFDAVDLSRIEVVLQRIEPFRQLRESETVAVPARPAFLFDFELHDPLRMGVRQHCLQQNDFQHHGVERMPHRIHIYLLMTLLEGPCAERMPYPLAVAAGGLYQLVRTVSVSFA